jgi:hypothetical protein
MMMHITQKQKLELQVVMFHTLLISHQMLDGADHGEKLVN